MPKRKVSARATDVGVGKEVQPQRGTPPAPKGETSAQELSCKVFSR